MKLHFQLFPAFHGRRMRSVFLFWKYKVEADWFQYKVAVPMKDSRNIRLDVAPYITTKLSSYSVFESPLAMPGTS